MHLLVCAILMFYSAFSQDITANGGHTQEFSIPRRNKPMDAVQAQKELEELKKKNGELEKTVFLLKKMYWLAEEQFQEYRKFIQEKILVEPPKEKNLVDIVSDLEYADFHEKYEKTRTPVILRGYWEEIHKETKWDEAFLLKKCGLKQFHPKVYDPDTPFFMNMKGFKESINLKDYFSVHWGKETRSEEALQMIDISLPTTCPTPLKYLTVPKYFSGDHLRKIPKNLNFVDVPFTTATPSVSARPKGAKSGIRVNPHALHAWSAQLVGSQIYRFFQDSQKLFLYEDRASECFYVDSFSPDYSKHPMFKGASFYDVEVKAGDIVFLPAEVPYQILATKQSLTLDNLFLDASNFNISQNTTVKFAATQDPTHGLLYAALERVINPLKVAEQPKDLPWSDFSNQVEGNWNKDGVQSVDVPDTPASS